MENSSVNIIGAGLGGLSAAITLAKEGVCCTLVSLDPSERAQSVLAEGGINAALDTMGEGDCVKEHFNDTIKSGCNLESEEAVKYLTESAPETVKNLIKLGVPFHTENGKIVLRNFGGQKNKRTAFVKSSTGKMIMTALIDEARKYEAQGLIKRLSHHELVNFCVTDGVLCGVKIKDLYGGGVITLSAPVILCSGGLNGFFDGLCTGSVKNSGTVTALAFINGVEVSDLEFIQYHPTTVKISGKRMLVSEAARGEGGRLFALKGGERFYYMEEKYPEYGNLMPRDVVSAETYNIIKSGEYGNAAYLDMTGIEEKAWKEKLSDLREEIIYYLKLDPKTSPVPIIPGIHYFMGGIKVDADHRTNVKGLFAAGECAAIYHGANRLGGNSMLGAIEGGKKAAESALNLLKDFPLPPPADFKEDISEFSRKREITAALKAGLGVLRSEGEIEKAIGDIDKVIKTTSPCGTDYACAQLAKAMLVSARERKESRGAHRRADYPESKKEFEKKSVAVFKDGKIHVSFKREGG